ncbi:ras-related protein Rab-5C [Patella vulgata]|uniref:ras-related protein Rab-5C n=1 Tax=Patella vulgata TaxID=6465 RepID=UPI00217F60C9|nr:ras-related protein Rab-5C [Patella vulgata]XP_050419394.1 ras-related protein Rab-5C [Patella vulgata]
MSNRQSGTPNGGKIQHVKLVLLGDQGVGKSSIALRFVRGEFNENNEATVGAAFLTQTVNIKEHSMKFDIWDTAGQERYHSLAPMYYRGAQAAVIVYDVTDTNTYERAIAWVKELRQHASAQITIVLAGNKADMAPESRAVQSEDARHFAENNDLQFLEASAKTGMAVSEIFMAVATKITTNLEHGGHIDSKKGIQLKGRTNSDAKKKKCC